MTEEALLENPDRYSLDQVKAYFDKKIIGRDGIPIDELAIDTREDAMMMAASIIYSGSEGFPYEVEFADGMIETEVAAISRIRIVRKHDE